MRLPIVILLILCGCARGNAQSAGDFIPSAYLDTITPGLYQLLKSRHTQEINNIQKTSKHKNDVKKAYKNVFESTLKQFNQDRMMMKSELSDYLTSIVERVAAANNFSPNDVNIFAYRSEVPNAICFGESVLGVHLGLLARLQTEDQVATIVCHELAHALKKDIVVGIEDEIGMINDRDTRKKINQARKSSYNNYSRTRELLLDLDRAFASHSRSHETSADSMGLVLYLKAGYDPGSSLKAMEVLRGADKDPYDTLDLRKFLVGNGVTIQPQWLEYANTNRWRKDTSIPDSLSTHPNITERTITMAKRMAQLGYSYDDLNQERTLNKNVYQKRAQLEMVDSEFYFRNYSRALYHAIQLSRLYPENAWLKAMIGRCLYEIYTRQRNHSLGTSVDLPDAYFSESYNRLLTLIHKLRLPEMEYITYQFMVSQPESLFTNEDFVYSLWLVSNFKTSKLDPDKVRGDYDELFPNGRYKLLMKTNPTFK